MNTEQQQRIEQIQRESKLADPGHCLSEGLEYDPALLALNYRAHIDFLLSIVKGQEAPDCWPDMAAINREYHYTVMRSACVAKVREMGQQWYAEAKKRGAAFSDKGRLAEMIAKELDSIQEQKS